MSIFFTKVMSIASERDCANPAVTLLIWLATISQGPFTGFDDDGVMKEKSWIQVTTGVGNNEIKEAVTAVKQNGGKTCS